MRNAYLRGTYLLGATDDNDLVFAKIWTRTIEQGNNQISISLDVVKPINENQFDVEDYTQNLVDSLRDGEKYQMCVNFDCAPSQLVDSYIAENGTDPRDYLDCSLYPECYEVNKDFWYFESEGCEQLSGFLNCITRPVFNKESISLIQKLQKECQLKDLDSETFNIYCDMLDKFRIMYKNFDEEKWITSYIKDEFYS